MSVLRSIATASMSVLTSIARYFVNPNPIKNSFVVVGCAVFPRRLYSVALDLLFFNLWLPSSQTVGFGLLRMSSTTLSIAVVIKFVKDITSPTLQYICY